MEFVFLYLLKTSLPSRLPPSWYHRLEGHRLSTGSDAKTLVEGADNGLARGWNAVTIGAPSGQDVKVRRSKAEKGGGDQIRSVDSSVAREKDQGFQENVKRKQTDRT